MLTVDEAVAAFFVVMKQHYGLTSDGTFSDGYSPKTSQQAEAQWFHMAEKALRAACRDPRLCTHPRCRRNRLCRHFADLHAVQEGRRKLPPSRRTPGETMLRHAIWVLMNATAGHEV
jgi:hypothetical protein